MSQYNEELDWDSSELRDYCNQVEAEYQATLATEPAVERFAYVSFVSKSKGRGRRRRNWLEVELVRDLGYPYVRWQSWEQVSWDEVITEIYPEWHSVDAERKLHHMIRKYC